MMKKEMQQFFNECYDILQNKSDEGNTSITQHLEFSEDMQCNNNSEANDSNRYDLSENISSQESQCSRKLVVSASRNSSCRDTKVKKFNFKKGERVKVRRYNLHHMLTHNRQKLGIEECGNSRNFYGAITSDNGKRGCNISFDDMPSKHN